jgi:hypothetical protein
MEHKEYRLLLTMEEKFMYDQYAAMPFDELAHRMLNLEAKNKNNIELIVVLTIALLILLGIFVSNLPRIC